MKKIPQEVLQVISSGVVEGNVFKILGGQLDRKLYVAVNEVLENIGGKWDRKQKGHTFPEDPTEKIEEVLLTGETVNQRQLYQFFETPKEVAERVVELAEIKDGMTLLEPSAGQGAILDAIPRLDIGVTAVEIQMENCKKLFEKGYQYYHEDFMEYTPGGNGEIIESFERIVMNPPFTKQQDIDHVNRAYQFLYPGGRLVSVMSPGFTFRENKKSKEFKALVEEKGFWEELPPHSFKESGTGVNTVIVVLNKEPSPLQESNT